LNNSLDKERKTIELDNEYCEVNVLNLNSINNLKRLKRHESELYNCPRPSHAKKEYKENFENGSSLIIDEDAIFRYAKERNEKSNLSNNLVSLLPTPTKNHKKLNQNYQNISHNININQSYINTDSNCYYNNLEYLNTNSNSNNNNSNINSNIINNNNNCLKIKGISNSPSQEFIHKNLITDPDLNERNNSPLPEINDKKNKLLNQNKENIIYENETLPSISSVSKPQIKNSRY